MSVLYSFREFVDNLESIPIKIAEFSDSKREDVHKNDRVQVTFKMSSNADSTAVSHDQASQVSYDQKTQGPPRLDLSSPALDPMCSPCEDKSSSSSSGVSEQSSSSIQDFSHNVFKDHSSNTIALECSFEGPAFNQDDMFFKMLGVTTFLPMFSGGSIDSWHLLNASIDFADGVMTFEGARFLENGSIQVGR